MPLEITASESYRQDLVDAGIVIRTEALAKVYQMGTEEVFTELWALLAGRAAGERIGRR
jgi:hypothetical protein